MNKTQQKQFDALSAVAVKMEKDIKTLNDIYLSLGNNRSPEMASAIEALYDAKQQIESDMNSISKKNYGKSVNRDAWID